MGAVSSSSILGFFQPPPILAISQQMPMKAEQGSNVLMSWSDIQHLPDDELLELGRTSPAVPLMKPCDRTIHRVCTDTVTKGLVSTHEVAALELVKSTTTIPVPAVRRFIFEPDSHGQHGQLFMEFIPAHTLDQRWPHLSLWRKLIVVWTLRGYVRQLRKIPQTDQGPRPGPLGDKPSECEGLLFGDYGGGPFNNYSELTDWYAHKLAVAQKMNKAPNNARPFDNTRPLVFTHLDLTPFNIILDDSNRLWIIDWGFSGIYPEWFEYACMMRNWQKLGGWYGKYICQFVAGRFGRQYQFILHIAWALARGMFM